MEKTRGENTGLWHVKHVENNQRKQKGWRHTPVHARYKIQSMKYSDVRSNLTLHLAIGSYNEKSAKKYCYEENRTTATFQGLTVTGIIILPHDKQHLYPKKSSQPLFNRWHPRVHLLYFQISKSSYTDI